MANDTILLYAVAPLVGFEGVPVAVVFTGTLVAGPLSEAFTLGGAFTLGEAFTLSEVSTLGKAFTLDEAFTLGETFTLDEVLSASPLHLFCLQHVASHFS